MPNRVYFASKKAGIAPLGSNSFQTIRGLQSIGMTTTFNLEQVFEIGQLAIYENIEGIPDISMEFEKVLDGHCPVYLLATQQAEAPSLAPRGRTSCHAAVALFDEGNADQADVNNADNPRTAEVQMSGLYVSAISYSATVDGNATESLTMVGNDKVWFGLVATATKATWQDNPFENNDDSPYAIYGSGGVNRREDVLFIYPGGFKSGTDINGAVSGDGTVLPIELPGISASGTNDKSGGMFGATLQNISISTDLGREEIFELGRRGVYYRYITFPVEVTTEIGMMSHSGDLISATEEGLTAGTGACPAGANLTDSTI
ncbi:uncharacterized protein METZ01_LOCUS141766, partial [marine metagenome]